MTALAVAHSHQSKRSRDACAECMAVVCAIPEAKSLRAALAVTIAAIEARLPADPYRDGWVDALRAIKDDPAVIAVDRIVSAARDRQATA